MKRLLTFLVGLTLICWGGGAVFAEDSPPAGYDIVDWVNIGDTVSESGHDLVEWGPSFDADNIGWGFTANSCCYREIWGWTNPPADYPAPEDSENWAEIDLDFTKPAHTGPLNLGFFFLAGAGDDNFNVYIDGTQIGTVTESQTNNTMVRKFLAVPAWVTAGIHTVKLECSEPAWSQQATYGQVTFDEVYTFTDPYINPVIEPVAADSDPINCSGSKVVDFNYTPGTTPDVRGYSVRVQCDASLTFGSADVTFYTVPAGVTVQHFVTEVTAGSVYDVDYAILGGSTGISAASTLFSVTFHGAATGSGLVSMASASLSALDGTPITPITSSGTAGVTVDCTPPDVPTMAAEPAYTAGLANTVDWSDESASGAAEYYAECASDAGFTTDLVNSGWITGLTWEFTGLTDGQTYYYRVKARDDLANESGWSGAESSTQDATAPATHVRALDQFQVDSFFDIFYDLDPGEDGSDYDVVSLFYQKEGDTGFTYFGDFVDATTPLVFDTGSGGTNTGDGTYYFYSLGTDNVGNTETPPAGSYDTSTTVDTSDLTVNYFRINDDDTYTTSTAVTLSMDVPGAVDMQFSNDGVTYSGWVNYAATYPWTLSAAEGVKTVYAQFREQSQHVTDTSDDITLDTTPPTGVTALTAARGQEKITLDWTNPGAGETELEVWRAVWYHFVAGPDTVSAYPEYDDWSDDAVPAWPADHAAAVADPFWTKVGTVTPPDATYDDDPLDRGIYYYVVYTRDAAGLYGDGAQASAISYLLGDVHAPFDGDVTAADITDLGAAYGTADGDPEYNNECDVGPTDDYSGAGIPETDDYVNFEDLMIFALNWDVTVSKAPSSEGGPVARLSWVKHDDATVSLVLNEPCAGLKGLNLQADVPADVILAVTAGSLLGQQESPCFLQNIPANGLDAGMALLGGGACITGHGELVRISVAGEIDPGDIRITARNGANEELEFVMEEATEIEDIPTRYTVSDNYPNPFNPSTKIDFSLPEPQTVKLMVYAVDGRLVATLVNESLPAGRHTVTWLGRNDQGELVASGIYFYRIQAGDFNRTRKMTLLK